MINGNLLIYVCATGGQAPEWIQILPLGKVALRDSREPFEVSQADLATIIAKFKADGLDVVIDYEHQSLSGDKAVAAGWIKELQARDDGLYGRVEWTKTARQHIEAHEYRYYSPVLKMAPKTRHPEELLHAALTNTPAMTKLAPLLAAKFDGGESQIMVLAAADPADPAQAGRAKKYGIGVKDGGNVTKPGQWESVPDEEFADPVNYRYPMPDHARCMAAWDYWNKPKNQEQYSPEERGRITARIKSRAKAVGMQIAAKGEIDMPITAKLKEGLALKAEATDEEVLAAMEAKFKTIGSYQEVCKALELPETATPGEINGAILALQSSHKGLAELHTEVTALRQELDERKAGELVDSAMQAGKVTPAQRDWAMSYAQRDPKGFVTYVSKALKVVPVGEGFKIADKPGDGTTLAAEDMEVCKSLGIAPEAYKAQRDKELAHKAGAQ